MITKPIAMLCAAAILASFFLPWFTTPFGQNVVPWELVQRMGDMPAQSVEQVPFEIVWFLSTFAVAAVFLLLCIFGVESKEMALITGLLPVGLVGWIAYSAASRASGMRAPQFDLPQVLGDASNILGAGAWAWGGGAILLIVLGVFSPRRKKPAASPMKA